MNRYPSNRYPNQRNDSFVSNRPRFNDQNQVQFRPSTSMHFQQQSGADHSSRRSANLQNNRETQAGMAPSLRRVVPGTPPSRPQNFNGGWHERGQETNMHRNYHPMRFMHQPRNAEGGNPHFNLHTPPMPQWANANRFQGIRSPSFTIPPPNFPPNIMPPFPPVRFQPDVQGMGQHVPWMPPARPLTASTEFEKSNKQQKQDDADRQFVDEWLLKRNIQKKVDRNKPKSIKIHEYNKGLQNYLKCIEELKTCRDVLMQFVNTDEDNWKEIVAKTNSIKADLETLQSKLFENEYLKGALNKVNDRRKKRERQRNARELKAKQKEEKQKKIILAHQRIDAWRHEIVSEINAKKMVDSLKSEAGQSLVEVRKKIADFTKYLEKCDSAKELRGIRRQTALQRGIFIFGDQDEQFEKRVENMRSLLKKRLEVYRSEEKTLIVMLEEEKEQLQKEDDSKRKKLMEKEHMRLFGYDPMIECRRYWLQAEVDPISLVQIRRLWDVYLVPGTIIGADYIPDGWVTPEPFKNAAWNKYLKKKSKEI